MSNKEGRTFPDFERPAGWQGMAIVDRCGWLRRNGVAADLLEAMEILKAAGEWPSEEALGMAGGRVLSRMTREEAARMAKRAAAPLSEGRLASRPPRRGVRPTRPRAVPAAPSSIDLGEGRRDRLADHY